MKIKFLDEDTRIILDNGFINWILSGKPRYKLQRKINNRWVTKAWTYPSSHNSYHKMKEYLFWYERDNYNVSKRGKLENSFYGESFNKCS